jgi:hypothetical protein
LSELTVVEICAGAGGQALGLEKAGFAHTRRLSLDPADRNARSRAINELAHSGGKRGSTPVPRRSRVRANDRAHAVLLMIRLLGLGEKIETTAQDAVLDQN